MTLPSIRVHGSPYRQGILHGTSLKQEVKHNLAVYFDRFATEGGVRRTEVLSRARRYARAIAQANPSYYAGMVGIATGSETTIEEIAALNVRYEILYYQYTVNHLAAADAADGCTAFAIAPSRTSNGHLLVGQNWDWIPAVKGAIVETETVSGLITLAFTEAGIFGGKIGLNSAGIGLVINGMSTVADEWKRLSSPFHVRCYEILQQSRLEEAIAVIEREPRACSANYLIAQVPDRAVDVEAAPDVCNKINWNGGIVVHANHFVNPESIGVSEPPDENRIYSCHRQERLSTLLATSPVGIGDLKRFLADHSTPPRSICRHEDLSLASHDRYKTVTSVIIDLHDQTMYVTDGPPCENVYTQLTINEESEP